MVASGAASGPPGGARLEVLSMAMALIRSKGGYHNTMKTSLFSLPFCSSSGSLRRSRRVGALLVSFLMLTSGAGGGGAMAQGSSLPELGDTSLRVMTPQLERRIGQAIMAEIRMKEPAYLDDREIESYVQRLGGSLVSVSDVGQPFHFFVLSDPTLNAFATFGGYVGIHTGLLLAAESEAELAGVLAHEISHVTQHHLARQTEKNQRDSLLSLAAFAVAVLAAQSSTQVASAATAAVEAGRIQSQLSYSRDFEREADRAGFDLMQKAGMDVTGMARFFERIQKASRYYETQATAYFRTHPLTTERMADLESRAQQSAYRQVPDSLEFHLVRAKLRAEEGTPGQAVERAQALVRERKFPRADIGHYQLARALWRAGRWNEAMSQVEDLRRLKTHSPMVEQLAADVLQGMGKPQAAASLLETAVRRFPLSRYLLHTLGDVWLVSGEAERTLVLTEEQLQLYPQDDRLYRLQAKAYAALGRPAYQHRSLGEAYALMGLTGLAIEQMELARQSGKGDFYLQSLVDVRLRELRQRQQEERQQKRL